MKFRKKKYLAITTLILICVALVFSIVSVVRMFNYRQTYEFKLQDIGYSKEETDFFSENFNEKKLDYLLEKEINNNIMPLAEDRYFIFNNLTRYLTLMAENDNDIRNIIAIVNAGADQGFYENIQMTNTNLDDPYLVLVNKFYKLPEDYEPIEIVNVSNVYAYENRLIDASIYDDFKSMWHSANNEGLTLIITSGFRDFETQKRIYNSFLANRGQVETDRISARPGHSEHQLGFALDITTHGYGLSIDFENSDEFAWLTDHAHLYGFILRYPKEAEHITGYSYEPWHFRFVGTEVAEYIYENQITFDEYYAYYIAK